MEYLKPIEELEQKAARLEKYIYALITVLAVLIIFLPSEIRKGSPLIVQSKNGAMLADSSSWNDSNARIEQFANAYLASRFSWTPENLSQKKSDMKALLSPQAFSKLDQSFTAYDSLAVQQKARSYYILEDFTSLNTHQKMELTVTRVLRIKNSALATPLHITLNYAEAEVSDANPYGLIVNAIDESAIPLEEK